VKREQFACFVGEQGITQEQTLSTGAGLMSVVRRFLGPPQGKSHG